MKMIYLVLVGLLLAGFGFAQCTEVDKQVERSTLANFVSAHYLPPSVKYYLSSWGFGLGYFYASYPPAPYSYDYWMNYNVAKDECIGWLFN